MKHEIIEETLRIFREAANKDEAAISLLQMIKLFYPELFDDLQRKKEE